MKFKLRLVAVIAATFACAQAGATPVTSGVEHFRYYLPDPNVVNVVKIDRSNPDFSLHQGFPYKRRNYPARETTSAIAARYDAPPEFDVVAAVNGGFFGTGRAISGALGSEDGIIQLPTSGRETFAFLNSREPYIKNNVTTSERFLQFADGVKTTIDILNYDTTPNTIALFTNHWGTTTGVTAQGIAVTLSDVNYPVRAQKLCSGIVTAIGDGAASVNTTIPAGAVVVYANGTDADLIRSKVSIGDRLNFKFALSDEMLNNASTYLNGAGWILKDGAPNTDSWLNYDDSTFDGVRHPRTALAWNATHIFMVTCDGRQGPSIGMTFADLASFLQGTLGATDAINLDGGGSTTMVVNGAVVNGVSDAGGERAIGNAVLLVKRKPVQPASLVEPFAPDGKALPWDDKLSYNPVLPFSPAAPGSDGHSLRLLNLTDGFESTHVGSADLADYCVESWVYCEYRPGTSGGERGGIYVRDNGNYAWHINAYGGGNCYTMRFDTLTGRLRAGRYINGAMTDLLPSPLVLQSTAWRKFGICCDGTTISYYLDGQLIHSQTDTNFASGPAGVAWHENFTTASNARGMRFDDFKLTVEPSPTSPGLARTSAVGQRVWLDNLQVKAIFPAAGLFYAGNGPGAIGIAVNSAVTALPLLGQTVSIVGRTKYADAPYDTELIVEPEYYIPGQTGAAPKTLRMANRTTGGAEFGLQQGVANSEAEAAIGLNSLGSLVSVWGALVYEGTPEEDLVYIDDGSALYDGDHTGLRVNMSQIGPAFPSGYPIYVISGIIRPLSRPGWALPVRELWPRYLGDIRTNP